MNYIKIIIFSILILFFIIIGVKQQIDINIMKDQNQELQKQNEQLAFDIEKLQNELDAPMDDEYIEKVASDQLGYRDPNAQYFYNDLPD